MKWNVWRRIMRILRRIMSPIVSYFQLNKWAITVLNSYRRKSSMNILSMNFGMLYYLVVFGLALKIKGKICITYLQSRLARWLIIHFRIERPQFWWKTKTPIISCYQQRKWTTTVLNSFRRKSSLHVPSMNFGKFYYLFVFGNLQN